MIDEGMGVRVWVKTLGKFRKETLKQIWKCTNFHIKDSDINAGKYYSQICGRNCDRNFARNSGRFQENLWKKTWVKLVEVPRRNTERNSANISRRDLVDLTPMCPNISALYELCTVLHNRHSERV